jgi:malonyl-CoA O-methyltransferase
MLCHDRVVRNFSRDPAAYESQARAQRRAAASLAGAIAAHFAGRTPPARILELGCGTGFLSRRIATAWPDADLTLSDLSPAMVEFCRHRLLRACRNRSGAIDFTVCNAVGTIPDGPFDLIAAALMAQWTPSLTPMLSRWRQQLSPTGAIAVSTLTADTFADIRAHFAAVDVPFPEPPLPTTKELAASITKTGLSVALWQPEIRREHYPSLHDFLRHLRSVGAGNAVAPHLSPAQLRRVLRHCRQTPITATYQIVNAILRG